jgi:hypothetical protein
MFQFTVVFRPRSQSIIPASGVLLLGLCCTSTIRAQAPGIVRAMVENEVAARVREPHFLYLSEERSTRTSGHLWKENVIETDDGQLRHLISIDGIPPSAIAAVAEERRIASLIQQNRQLRKPSGDHSGDRSPAMQLLTLLPRAFLFSPAGDNQGCLRFAFQPNPAFKPATSEERIFAAMQGTIDIKESVNRLCSVEARVGHPVQFGLGVFGRVDQGGHIRIVREPVNANDWQITHISLQLDGRILIMKSLSRKIEAHNSNFHVVPQHQSLAEAVELIRHQ